MSLERRKRHQTKVLLDTIDRQGEELTLHRETLFVVGKLLDEGNVDQARLALAGLKAQSKIMEGRF